MYLPLFVIVGSELELWKRCLTLCQSCLPSLVIISIIVFIVLVIVIIIIVIVIIIIVIIISKDLNSIEGLTWRPERKDSSI